MSDLDEVRVMVPPAVGPPRGAEAAVWLVLLVRDGLQALKRRVAVHRGAPSEGRLSCG